MTPEESKREKSEMGCLLKTLAYIAATLFGAGFLSGIALIITIF